MLLKFGSQLDQNLKDLHRTVLGSVSQQQQQLRTMEEHTHTFLVHIYDATQDLESRIGKIAALKELYEIIQKKASSNLEKNSSIVSQIAAVEKFLTISATEASAVAHDIHNTLNDQKIEDYLEDCLGRANDSKTLWETTETGIKNLNTKYQQVLNVTMEDMAKESERGYDVHIGTWQNSLLH
ncbi:PREDICTED: kinesin-like protein KIN-5B [Camelina sativa]|uniref:Kinesin-like protein KIN-5B n=1 Tax=Camelina sativa TaxID=90675 RepID=A0ABM0UF67_CAMSA|nr:PREDICTED: kinesin-like protein KIN-5B [Camelina sativa]